ncbi:SDR family oxidoreductase [Amycolatopsis jejuensis]|uniref:SDR family oxidoreductase n=1 Tax=Amycolatopsis jejuensis TaxID=330084 RepID=UPI0005275912
MPHRTPSWSTRRTVSAEGQVLAAAPAGRVGDIASAVVFLASPAASYRQGSSLVIDGGWIDGGSGMIAGEMAGASS